MHATHATQALALCALRKRKPKALDWLLRWLAALIDHSYWLALAFVAWKILRNVFACVIFLRLGLLRFLRTFYFACVFFLTQDLACVAYVWMGLGHVTTSRLHASNSTVSDYRPYTHELASGYPSDDGVSFWMHAEYLRIVPDTRQECHARWFQCTAIDPATVVPLVRKPWSYSRRVIDARAC